MNLKHKKMKTKTNKQETKSVLNTAEKVNNYKVRFIELEKAIRLISGIWNCDDKAFAAILAIVMSIFHDFLEAKKDAWDISGMKCCAEIVQKLTNCYATIKNIEMRSKNLKSKEEENELKKQKIRDTLKNNKEFKNTLSPETLQYIEENLRFI
jgi:hypothetical protein